MVNKFLVRRKTAENYGLKCQTFLLFYNSPCGESFYNILNHLSDSRQKGNKHRNTTDRFVKYPTQNATNTFLI